MELKKAILKQLRCSVTTDRIKAWVSIFFYVKLEKIVSKGFLKSASDRRKGGVAGEGHSLRDLPVRQGGEGVYSTEAFKIKIN